MLEFISLFTNTFDRTFWDLLIYYVLNKKIFFETTTLEMYGPVSKYEWKGFIDGTENANRPLLPAKGCQTRHSFSPTGWAIVGVGRVSPSLWRPHYTHGLLHQYRHPWALSHILGRSVVTLLFVVLKHSLPLICYNLPAQRGWPDLRIATWRPNQKNTDKCNSGYIIYY